MRTLSIRTLSVWALSVRTLFVWTLSVWTLSVWTLSVWTLSSPFLFLYGPGPCLSVGLFVCRSVGLSHLSVYFLL